MGGGRVDGVMRWGEVGWGRGEHPSVHDAHT